MNSLIFYAFRLEKNQIISITRRDGAVKNTLLFVPPYAYSQHGVFEMGPKRPIKIMISSLQWCIMLKLNFPLVTRTKLNSFDYFLIKYFIADKVKVRNSRPTD